MDIGQALQLFEEHLSNYTGDDPLHQWHGFVGFLEQRIPAEEQNSIAVVLDRLVQTFLPQTRYYNDERFISSCIKFASYRSEPLNVYSFIYGKGIGCRTAALYTAWAEQFEKRGLLSQADAVYQKGLEQQVEPAGLVLQQYRLFQDRMAQIQTVGTGPEWRPLQTSQQVIPRDHPTQPGPENSPADQYIHLISRSENNPKRPRQGPAEGVQVVSMYCVNELVCEGSELSFEELRAGRYMDRCRQEELRKMVEQQQRLLEEEEAVKLLQERLAELDCKLGCGSQKERGSVQDQPLQAFSQQELSSANLKVEMNPTWLQQSHVQAPRPNAGSESTAGASSTSLVHWAGAGRTVNPQRALGLSLPRGSFQQPGSETLRPREPCLPSAQMGPAEEGGLSRAPLGENPAPGAPAPPLCPPAASAAAAEHTTLEGLAGPFGLYTTPYSRASVSPSLASCSFGNSSAGHLSSSFHQHCPRQQDVPDGVMSEMGPLPDLSQGGTGNLSQGGTGNLSQGNTGNLSQGGTGNLSHVTPNTSLGLVQATPSRVLPSPTVNTREALDVIMNMFQAPTLFHDEDDRFEASCRISCPKSPAAHAPFPIFQDENMFPVFEDDCKDSGRAPMRAEQAWPRLLPNVPMSKPTKQTDMPSPVESMAGETMMGGAHYNSTLAPCPNSTWDFGCSAALASTAVQPNAPPSWDLEDQENGSHTVSRRSEEMPHQHKPEQLSPILEETEQLSKIEEHVVKPHGRNLAASSSAVLPHPAAALSSSAVLPQPAATLSFPGQTAVPAHGPTPVVDVCMSPEHCSTQDRCLLGSTAQASELDWEVPMSPEKPPTYNHDLPGLLSNPWDDNLITSLLSRLPTPISSYSGFESCDCNLPSFSSKTTLVLGEKSLRVDCVLGQGAFATVYKATDVTSSSRLALKVQSPANPWEFYINGQLNQRLRPGTRHLFNDLYAAYVFHNGIVLMSELHQYGTLLEVTNLYKKAVLRVMPQPLVLYFAVSILHMVEQLHSAHIIHADIKPDNFMLGQRFIENRNLEPDCLEHGLTLIDLGQGIDMKLFPEGTAFTAKCLTSGFQCTEMLDGRPWNYQTDYFGIAGTVYCLMFGTYMKVKKELGVWKTHGSFKRVPHGELWTEFFDALLNVPDCRSLPSLPFLRSRLTAVLQENYSSKLRLLKSQLAVLLQESKRSGR